MATPVFAGASRNGQAMAEMNITPLVDVMLVLLIIFMLSTPMVTGSLEMRLPQTPPPRPEITEPPRLSLRVQADGSYALDGTVLGERALHEALAAAARSAPDTVVEVAASEQAEYQAFTTALAAARSSGIRNIALP